MNKFIIKVFLKLLILVNFIIIQSNANTFKIKDLEIKLFDKNSTLESKKRFMYEVADVRINTFAEEYKNNEIRSIVTILDIKTTRYSVSVKQFLEEYFFHKKISVFKDKDNKNLLLVNKKKSNLVSVNELNLTKYLNTSDDFPEYKRVIRNLTKRYNINLPERVLNSDHLYFKGNGDVIWISHMFNYKTALENKNFQIDKLNFQPNLITNYPELNNYMNDWINLSLSRHNKFQNKLKIKNKLDLQYSTYNSEKDLNDYRNLFYKISNNQLIEKEKKAKLAAEKKAKEEKEKKAKLAAEQKLKEEKEKKAKLAAEKKAKEEKEKKAKLAAEQKLKEEKEKKAKLAAEQKAKDEALKPNDELSVDDIMSKIKELSEMYKSGLISKEEFEMLKSKLLKN